MGSLKVEEKIDTSEIIIEVDVLAAIHVRCCKGLHNFSSQFFLSIVSLFTSVHLEVGYVSVLSQPVPTPLSPSSLVFWAYYCFSDDRP